MKRPGFTFAESGADRFLSAHLSNAQYNRLVWTAYPFLWRLGSLAGVKQPQEAAAAEGVVGEEWGTPASVEQVLERFVFPYVGADSVVGEIGVGGGRMARRVAPRVRTMVCMDISSGMLRKAREAMAEADNTRFIRLKQPSCPPELRSALDFVYAFDVFVHFDLHATWRYVRLMAEMLKPGGKALVHVASLDTVLGWEMFARQQAFSVAGLYWLSPEMVGILARNAGLSVVADSKADDTETGYTARDYIAVLVKASQSEG